MKSPLRRQSRQGSIVGQLHLMAPLNQNSLTHTGESSKEPHLTNRNVRFNDHAQPDQRQQQTVADSTQPISSKKLTKSPAKKTVLDGKKKKKPMMSPEQAENGGNPEHCFEKSDFLRVQKPSAGSLYRTAENRNEMDAQATLNFKILSEAEDLDAISASVGDRSKLARGDSKRSSSNARWEKDGYSHRLMLDVKSSINRRKREPHRGDSSDQSMEGGGGSSRRSAAGGRSSHRSQTRKQLPSLGSADQFVGRQDSRLAGKSRSVATLKGTSQAQQSLPPLGTSNLLNQTGKEPTAKVEKKSSLIAGIRTRENSVKFDDKVKVMTGDVGLMAPFVESDAS